MGPPSPEGARGEANFFRFFKIFNFALKIFWFNYTETVQEYTCKPKRVGGLFSLPAPYPHIIVVRIWKLQLLLYYYH